MEQTNELPDQYELRVSRPTFVDDQPAAYLLHPSNIGYKLSVNGGGIANFTMTGIAPCWLNELHMRFNLPEPGQNQVGNSSFGAVSNLIRTLADGVVPHENMAIAEMPSDRLADELRQIADELDAHYGADLIPIFPLTWVFQVTDPDYHGEPAILSLTPTIRESLASAPGTLGTQFLSHLNGDKV